MLFFIFLIVAIFCTHKIFVVPDNDNAYVYISLKLKDLPGTYIIRELLGENCVKDFITPNNQTIKSEDKTKLHYFKQITPKEYNLLKHFLDCYKIINIKDRKNVEFFMKEVVLAVAKIPTKKNYFMFVMKSKNYVTVDTYSNSKKFTLDKFPRFYSIKLFTSYDFKEDKRSHFIPSLNKNALLKFSEYQTINEEREKINKNLIFKLQKRDNGGSEEYLNTRANAKFLKYSTIDTKISEVDDSFEYRTPEQYHKIDNEADFNAQETHEKVQTPSMNRSRLNGLFSSVQNLFKLKDSSNHNGASRRNRRWLSNSDLNQSSRR
ncbi:uncharacterized protein VNE69_08115 [Vairimorpha necatrix]|uniref:Uncharacterized protein n=1 Tax=Vairimorpha necatrix TaxID=6039 RepID=A0AAX4JEK1_9MICR